MTISHQNRLRSTYLQKVCAPTQASNLWYRYSCWVYRHLLIEEHMTMQFVCTNIQKLYLSPWLNVEILDVHANHAWKQFFLSLLLQALYADPVRPSTHKCGTASRSVRVFLIIFLVSLLLWWLWWCYDHGQHGKRRRRSVRLKKCENIFRHSLYGPLIRRT